jgi:uncharacterized protein
MEEIKNELKHLGYSKEEEYFFRKNMELVAKLRMEADEKKKKLAEEHGLREYWMRCPKCGTTLVEQSLQDIVQVDKCANCGGVFFDSGELAILLKAEHSLFHRIFRHHEAE